MDKKIQWEYRVQSFGSLLRDAKDEELQIELNTWGSEGWEVTAAYPNGNKVTIIARRSLDASARRQRSWEAVNQA